MAASLDLDDGVAFVVPDGCSSCDVFEIEAGCGFAPGSVDFVVLDDCSSCVVLDVDVGCVLASGVVEGVEGFNLGCP